MKKMSCLIAVMLTAGVVFAAQNYVSDAGIVTHTASGDIDSGEIVDLGGRYGIALVDIDTGDDGSVMTRGVWRLLRNVTNEITAGTALYRHSDTTVTDVAAGNTYIGKALITSTGAAASSILVDLNAMPRQVVVGVDVQAYDADLDRLALNNGGSLTNLNGANIASGDIPSDRMTAHGVVVTDFTQNSGVLVGTGAGTFAEETGDTLRTSLGLAIGTDVEAYDADIQSKIAMLTRETATVGASLELLEGTNNGTDGFTIAAPNSLAAARTITLADEDYDLGDIKSKADAAVAGDTITSGVSTVARVGTVTITNSLATSVHMTGWLSATAGGVAEDTSLVSIADGGNTTVISAAGSATCVFVCHSDGVATLTVTVDANVNRYFNVVQRNGVVHSTAVMGLTE